MNIVESVLASSECDIVFAHMVEMAILVTRLVVEFAKHLPGFETISKDDQITLLKVRTTRRHLNAVHTDCRYLGVDTVSCWKIWKSCLCWLRYSDNAKW